MKFKIAESIQDKGIFKVIFMAGSPGAGKSYVLSKLSDGSIDPRIVNTDKFVEFFGGNDPVKERPFVLDKSKLLSKQQLYFYINSILPLFVDSTSSEATTCIRRNGLLESLGYDTGMVFVNTSLETALKRIEQRERKITDDWTKKIYNTINEAKAFYKSHFPFFLEIDNDEGMLTDEVVANAFKKVKGFYDTPINNPEGKSNIKKMRSKGWKYLADGIASEEYIQKVISVWYRT